MNGQVPPGISAPPNGVSRSPPPLSSVPRQQIGWVNSEVRVRRNHQTLLGPGKAFKVRRIWVSRLCHACGVARQVETTEDALAEEEGYKVEEALPRKIRKESTQGAPPTAAQLASQVAHLQIDSGRKSRK